MSRTLGSEAPFSLNTALKLCRNNSNKNAITRLTPLRCMKRREDGSAYDVVPYNDEDYLAISYSWPGGDWIRLHDSNKPTTVSGLTGDYPLECLHFSSFARKAVEDPAINPGLAIWLDYVCINQSNKAEKDIQIALMDKFYSDARVTVVLLEDVEISTREFNFLQSNYSQVKDNLDEYVRIVRRILGARWFKRAWCSQEWVLSRSPTLFVHRSDDISGSPMRFSWASLKHWMNRAAIFDPSINRYRLTDPRGLNTRVTRDDYFRHTVAWAFGIVHGLGCFNPYDKISLVNNLIHADMSARIVDLPAPPSFDSDKQVVSCNVAKVINVLAILRGDFSLLLTTHVPANPLRGVKGYSWAGTAISGDAVSESWSPKLYEVEKAVSSLPMLDDNGLLLRGIAMEILEQTDWAFHRDVQGLHVTVNGKSQGIITSDWLYNESKQIKADQAFLRDLCYLIDDFKLVDIYQLIFDTIDDQWAYDADYGDLKTQLQAHFAGYSSTVMFFTSRLSFLHDNGVHGFTIATFGDNLKLLLRGNVSNLKGKILFQPYVIRPKRFAITLPTINSLVAEKNSTVEESSKQIYRCLGGVRGFGLLPVDGHEIDAYIV